MFGQKFRVQNRAKDPSTGSNHHFFLVFLGFLSNECFLGMTNFIYFCYFRNISADFPPAFTTLEVAVVSCWKLGVFLIWAAEIGPQGVLPFGSFLLFGGGCYLGGFPQSFPELHFFGLGKSGNISGPTLCPSHVGCGSPPQPALIRALLHLLAKSLGSCNPGSFCFRLSAPSLKSF